MDFTKSKDPVADVRAVTTDGLGAHGVIVLAATEKPFQQAVEYVRSCGTVVAIGLPSGAFLKAPVLDTVIRKITIKGSYVGNRQDGVEAVEFFNRGLIKAPFKKAPLKDLPHIFELMGMSACSSSNCTRYLFLNSKIQSKAKSQVDMCWKCRNR